MFNKQMYWLRSRFWFIPLMYGGFAVLLAIFSLWFESRVQNTALIHSLFLSDLDLSQTILSSISASLLTMTTITFSTILVVLTTYLSEFSPRALQNFIIDKHTQRVLGIFVGGFIYSILLLLFLRESTEKKEFVVPSFAVLLAIICLIVFVFFIHHVSSWIQVSNLIHTITLETVDKIEKDLQDRKDVNEDAPWEDWESEEISHMKPIQILGKKAGYIQHFDVDGLMKQATKDDCIVKVEKEIGEYVDEDTSLLSIWTMYPHNISNDYDKYISVGARKVAYDDIEFGLIKLVEIGLRALSSGINDPNTAINCIENLGKLLAKLGKKHLPRNFLNDEEKNLRVILQRPSFADYLYKSFYQIRQNGSDDISVLSSLISTLAFIAESNSELIKQDVWEFSQYIVEGIDREALLSLDRKHLNKQLTLLYKATGHKNKFEPI
ncbi:DUF2254 domain-containing protein [Salirhabdus salicampi]|uniref:DUF2254 domain-containing protein n=1 Tax=Salirhabdus salicampi TaxID=476102 RepID=UPI0020C36342|nr:DUF2254 domain-containing protein [Salirhabdus salicampi]MCP8616242.1 DUF2254 domain-containing protein [Salirhabdus salicampi]